MSSLQETLPSLLFYTSPPTFFFLTHFSLWPKHKILWSWIHTVLSHLLSLLTCFPDSEVSSPKSSHLFICYLIFKTYIYIFVYEYTQMQIFVHKHMCIHMHSRYADKCLITGFLGGKVSFYSVFWFPWYKYSTMVYVMVPIWCHRTRGWRGDTYSQVSLGQWWLPPAQNNYTHLYIHTHTYQKFMFMSLYVCAY